MSRRPSRLPLWVWWIPVAINLLLFVPFGVSFVDRPGRLRWLPLAAAAVSASAELSQLFSTVRYPSGTDVVYAIVGAMAGGVLAARLRRSQIGGA